MKSLFQKIVLSACLVPTVLAAPALALEPSRDIESYVPFALTDLDFKGRNADPTRGFITGGNVGVNCIDDFDPTAPLMGFGANGAVVMSNGMQVVTDSGRINSNSDLYDLFVNDLWGSSMPNIRHSGPNRQLRRARLHGHVRVLLDRCRLERRHGVVRQEHHHLRPFLGAVWPDQPRPLHRPVRKVLGRPDRQRLERQHGTVRKSAGDHRTVDLERDQD
ncbi:MAG TPA: hypothetical protein VF720_10485, partial [Candidatus Eisenbacteria bacterium]